MKSERSQCKEPLLPFSVPETPFETVGMDLFYVEGVDYLLLVDYLTKWPVVKKLARGTRSEIVIDALREAFADFGQPDRFASVMFKQFCKSLNIRHVTSSPSPAELLQGRVL